MGLMDLLKRKTPLEKAAKELKEAYAQPEYRRAAMTTLLEIGTEEAYTALLKRFTYNANGHIADESEKRDLVEELSKVGEPAVPAIKTFIQNEKAIGFPINALGKILKKDELVSFLLETLKGKEPLDHRSTEAKRALILAVSERGTPELAPEIVPYLGDHHDDVQFQAIDTLERMANEEASREALVEVCVGDDHGPRIQRRAAQALINLKWSAKERFDEFNQELKDEYILGKKGYLVKKGAKKED